MSRFTSVFLVLAGCGFDMGSSSIDAPAAADAAIADAAIDAPEIDAPDLCIGEGAHEVCFATLPTEPVQYAGNPLIDTSDPASCTPTTNAAAAGWCVIAGSQIDVFAGSIVRGIGSRPLVFAATGEILIVGYIDVSSRGNAIGAGGNAAQCAAGTNATAGNSAGGGYGGSYGGRGANGEGNDGGAGGISPGASSDPSVLRGGCPGGPGGPIQSTVAPGGAGGGAIAILSRTKIHLAGAINASGAGGRVGGAPRQGSGGGGSGGMIVLDAPLIDATGAIIWANGGGGGEGNDVASVGLAGTEPLSASQPGEGGHGTTGGGDGGSGSTGGNGGLPPMNATATNAGGGGGGGGTGVIVTNVPLTGAEVSPGPVGMQL